MNLNLTIILNIGGNLEAAENVVCMSQERWFDDQLCDPTRIVISLPNTSLV